MDSGQFHDAAIEYVRQVAMASLTFESNGLTWEVAGEPLLQLLRRMIDDADTPFDFDFSSCLKEEGADEVSVSININLFDDDWECKYSYSVEEKNLSDILLQDFPELDAEYVLDNIAAVERSCVIARAKLAARMDEEQSS